MLYVFSTSKQLNLASLADIELAMVGMLIGSGQPGVVGAAGEEQPQNSNSNVPRDLLIVEAMPKTCNVH